MVEPAQTPALKRLAALASLAARPFGGTDEAISSTIRLIADLFDVGLVLVQRLDADDFVITHVEDRLGLDLQTPITVPRKSTFCDAVVASVAPLLAVDAATDPRYQDLPGRVMIGSQTYIGVPILFSDGRVYGTLCAHDRRVLRLGAAEIETLLILARFVASHLEREMTLAVEAETARRLRRRNAELAEVNRQLDALNQITESIAAELDLQALLRQVIASAVTLLGAHGGAISLVGDHLDAPRRLTATYNLPPIPGAEDVPARSGLMGQVIAAQGPVVVERDDDLDAPLPSSAFHDLGPWVAVPIWWQGAIAGTFGIGANDPRRRFGEREIDLLTQLAKHAAVAIENARLYAASRGLGAAEERNRLAREIHDTLAQSLLALIFQLRTAAGLVATNPASAAAELTDAETRTRAALDEARRSVWNLSSAALEAGTLVDAIGSEVAMTERTGPTGRLVLIGTPRPLPPELQLAVLRVAQEALANVRKHAAARTVEVTIDFQPSAVILTVQDDGVGFDPAAVDTRGASPSGGLGLPGMTERLRRLGGRLDIESHPGAGTLLRAVLPTEGDEGGFAGGRGRETFSSSLSSPSPPSPPLASPRPPRPPSPPIRVLVADDHPTVRAGIVALLAGQPGIAVVGQAADGEEALRLVAELRPDVLLVDLRMPVLGGVETIARLAAAGAATRAVAVTTFAQDEQVLQALRAGARGYLLKDADGDDLAAAVRAGHAGGTHLAPAVAGKLTAGLIRHEHLTARERQVLDLLARGLADKEIAARLGTSAKTANFHVANLLSKLAAANRTEAVRIAYDRGLLVE